MKRYANYGFSTFDMRISVMREHKYHEEKTAFMWLVTDRHIETRGTW